MTMGEKIHYYRKLKNMTQSELAKRVGVSFQAIYKYEKGICTNIPVERLELIANALDVSASALRSSLVVANDSDPYDEFLDDVDADDLTEDEIKRRRLYSVISHTPSEYLDDYASVLSLPPERIKALVMLLNIQGGKA